MRITKVKTVVPYTRILGKVPEGKCVKHGEAFHVGKRKTMGQVPGSRPVFKKEQGPTTIGHRWSANGVMEFAKLQKKKGGTHKQPNNKPVAEEKEIHLT